MRKNKSVKINMILNVIKGLLGIVFPLITFPYATRVLGVNNIGRYNFSTSVVSYFSLLSGLGISTYAIREGAKIRDNKEKLSEFASKMFTINIYSTICSYILLLITCILYNKLHGYYDLIFLLSIQILFQTLGVEWIYSIHEDFIYITLRSIVFQILSLTLLFVLVRERSDLSVYAIITVISSVGSNVLNFLHSKRYCNIALTRHIELRKHIKPILVMFAMTAAVTIYISSDITILGIICGDKVVGIYSVSTKIYAIVKTVISSVIVVSIPRLANLYAQEDKTAFVSFARDIYSTLLTILLPCIIGLILVRNQVIMLVAGEEYQDAGASLFILCIAMLFCFGAYFWAQCILVTLGKESFVLKVTLISALINIIANIILIPIWKENAAALTTMISELFSFVVCRIYGGKLVQIKNLIQLIFKIIIGSMGIALTCVCFRIAVSNDIVYILLSVSASVIIYCIIELSLKNESAISMWKSINRFISKRRNV